MHLQLSAQATEVMSTYLTCEFATFSKDGTPIAWPVTALFQPESGSLLISTTIGFPQKAVNVRRDGRVSVLFSDPTGSRLTGEALVLLQGSARCTDEIETGFATRAGYWSRLLAIQPPTAQSFAATALGRRLMDAYFMRLYITVTPRIETVTSASAIAAATTVAPRRRHGSSAFQSTAAALARFESAVLAANSSTGYATLQRVLPVARVDESSFAIVLEPGVDVVAGPASFLCHRHDERLENQSSFVTAGEIRRGPDGWVFVPSRFIPGVGPGVLSQIAALRTLRRRARRYLARRGLQRPTVAWGELAELAGKP
jgi:hypothetical protein